MHFSYTRELAGGARASAFNLDSSTLQGNPLGDPSLRSHPVLVPKNPSPGLPLVLVLGGYTGFGHKFLNKSSLWEETLVERLACLQDTDLIPPAVFAMPSCETRLGGSQYLNSTGTGRYEDMVIQELVPALENEFECGGEGNRIVVGKSSGGFGALSLVMRNPGFFRAAASHCGDMAFDLCQMRGFPDALTCWKKFGGPEKFLQVLPDLKFDFGVHAGVECIAMSTCYSPNPDSSLGCDLPVDPETGAVNEAVFARWLEYDPLRMVANEPYADALRQLDCLYLDAGERDEFALQWALRRFLPRLTALEIPHHAEFFDGGHFQTDGRYEVSLPLLLG